MSVCQSFSLAVLVVDLHPVPKVRFNCGLITLIAGLNAYC